jgi:Phytanoyl-CoA dioxygenase (PhyH)
MEDLQRIRPAPSLGQLIKSVEIEGYVLLPGLLDEQLVQGLRRTLDRLPLKCSDYTDRQWYLHDVQWIADPFIGRAIANPRALAFLAELFADDILCVGASFSRSDPGYAGMPLHTDSHPYGSGILGARATSPVLVRVLCYLDELTPQHSPLRVVPASHLSLHRDAEPYRRYRAHAEEVVLTCRAGDAIVINQRVFHGAGANTSSSPRRMFAATYRPAWAGPAQTMPEPDESVCRSLRQDVRKLVASPNLRTADTSARNVTPDLPVGGPGLGPGRWER